MRSSPTFELRYSPNGKCAEKLVEVISATKSKIRAMVFSATLDEVSEALIKAKNRGVDVQVVLDRKQTKGDQAKFHDKLEAVGVEIRLYSPGWRSYMHHKVGIFDGKVVTTGSFNWTKNAERNNNENLITMESPEIAEAYAKIFDELWKVASPEARFRRVRRFGRFVLSFIPVSARYYPANQ